MISLAHPLSSWPAQTVAPARRGRTPPDWLPTPELIRQLPRLLELATVPGLAIAVVERGRIWERGFGRARTDPSRQMADDTVFEAASLGKPLFAYEVLRLVDAGALELDRPLYDYLPTPEADNARMRRVTARHVLSHTTGLPELAKGAGAARADDRAGNRVRLFRRGIFLSAACGREGDGAAGGEADGNRGLSSTRHD